MIGAGSMRRVLLLLLTVFLASGTIAGSIAHAIEERAEMSQPAMMLDSGCLSASVADVAEPEKQSSPDDQKQTPTRSEEHTSELQSLMRISYAVFCLKKKKTNQTTILHQHHIL